MGVSEPLIQTSLLGEAVENGPVAVLVADEHGRYVAVNRAACALLGYTREELLALRLTDVARYDEAPAEWAEMELHGTHTGVSKVTCKDGSTIEFAYVAGATVVAGMPVYVSVGRPPRTGDSATSTPSRWRDRSRRRCTHEVAKQRRGPRRPRLELRVELARHEPRVVGQLDDLHQPARLERARDDQAVGDEPVAELVVHLVAVPVALVDHGVAGRFEQASVPSATSTACAPGSRIVPPRSSILLLLQEQVDHRDTASPGSISVEFAPLEPASRGARTRRLRRCMPRRMPRYRMLRSSQATRHARILPSQPREPKPPGTSTPSTCSNSASASSSDMPSASTQRTCKSVPCWTPACLSASCTER